MNILPSHMYRDPARIYESKEGRTCKGCCEERRVEMLGVKHTYCGKGKRHDMRCKQYKIIEITTEEAKE